VNAVLGRLSFERKISTPQEFATFLGSEMRKWPPILKAAGIKPE
jgi:tripartite-type tricarboxylate transporter receptor subunit TctC